MSANCKDYADQCRCPKRRYSRHRYLNRRWKTRACLFRWPSWKGDAGYYQHCRLVYCFGPGSFLCLSRQHFRIWDLCLGGRLFLALPSLDSFRCWCLLVSHLSRAAQKLARLRAPLLARFVLYLSVCLPNVSVSQSCLGGCNWCCGSMAGWRRDQSHVGRVRKGRGSSPFVYPRGSEE